MKLDDDGIQIFTVDTNYLVAIIVPREIAGFIWGTEDAEQIKELLANFCEQNENMFRAYCDQRGTDVPSSRGLRRKKKLENEDDTKDGQ